VRRHECKLECEYAKRKFERRCSNECHTLRDINADEHEYQYDVEWKHEPIEQQHEPFEFKYDEFECEPPGDEPAIA